MPEKSVKSPATKPAAKYLELLVRKRKDGFYISCRVGTTDFLAASDVQSLAKERNQLDMSTG